MAARFEFFIERLPDENIAEAEAYLKLQDKEGWDLVAVYPAKFDRYSTEACQYGIYKRPVRNKKRSKIT